MDRLKARFPIYSRLLRLYPIDYQHKYSEQMLQMLADMLDDPERTKTSVWLRTALDFPVSVSKQQVIYAGAAMTHDTPNYLKRNTLLGAVLLLPFPAAVILENLTRRVPVSHDWKLAYLSAFTILPTLASLLCATTFLYWLFDRRHRTSTGFWKSLTDIRRNWLLAPLAAVIGLGLLMALFVPFHDSAHCVSGNPIHELGDWHQTWRCIQQSQ